MTAIPLLLVAVATLGVPPPVHEIPVVASAFTFEPATIEVVAGERVRLLLRSSTAAHGFAIADLQIAVRIPKAGQVTVEFTAPPIGRYEIACSEFCGIGHTQMKAALVSVAQARRVPSLAASWTFAAAAATDWATTLHYLEFHHGQEDNPLINWAPTPATTVAIGAASDVLSFLVWRRLTRHHPRLANAGLFLESGLRFFVAARNEYRIAHSSPYNCVDSFSHCR
jgi:plastocyanin